ncbi:MAG: putative RNase H-like HicB family nuclease [Verrucomicrobiales bacterium]|jgi:predicted RNase H-like HicB family nuclease
METIQVHYPVVLHKDEGTEYGVSAPDLLGCISVGSTFAQALKNMKSAMEFHIRGMLADDDEVPEPQPIEVHLPDEVYEQGIWALVELVLPAATFAKRPAAA